MRRKGRLDRPFFLCDNSLVKLFMEKTNASI